MPIIYKDKILYQLYKTYKHKTKIRPISDKKAEYIVLKKSGELIISDGYTWDGPTGALFHTKTIMRGSLVHDALYELMRFSELNYIDDRIDADLLFKEICIQSGMCLIRAWLLYIIIRIFGKCRADPAHKRHLRQAP